MKSVGERIKKLRVEKGLTAKEISERLNINASTISKLENDKKSIDSDELKKYASFFSTSADFILGLDTSADDVVMCMKRDKNLEESDIKDIQFIMDLMDEATFLYSKKYGR